MIRQPALARSGPSNDVDIRITFDGGSRGNPGQGYGSFVSQGVITTEKPVRLEYPGRLTNNEAEYQTLIEALRSVQEQLAQQGLQPGTLSVQVLSDSKLVVEQVNQRWKIKQPHLLPLATEARQLLRAFGRFDLAWHGRAESVRLLGH